MYVERIRRGGKIIDFDGDTVLVAGRRRCSVGSHRFPRSHCRSVQRKFRQGTARHSRRVGRSRSYPQGAQRAHPDRSGAGRFRPRCLPRENHSRGDEHRRADTRADEDLSRRHPQDLGSQAARRTTRASRRLRRPAVRNDGHGLGGAVHRRLRPDWRRDIPGWRHSADAFHVRRRADRRPAARLAARRVPDVRSPAGTDTVVHELRRLERVHRDRRHFCRAEIHRRI